MSTSPTPRRIRSTVDDIVAAMPHLVGYHPGDGDVAVFMTDRFDRNVLTANLVADQIVAVNDLADACDQMIDVALRGEAAHAIVVGYGQAGTGRAAALRDALATHLDRVNTFAVDGRSWGDIPPGSDRIEQWFTMPDVPEWAEDTLPTPASSRDAAAANSAPLPTDQVGADVSDQAHAALRDSTGPVRLYAAEALDLLAKAGSGSAPSTRAMLAALITRDKNVRDAVVLDVVDAERPLLTNLEYAARTAADRDVAEMCALAGTARYLCGRGDPLTRGLLEQGQSTRLGRLALSALTAGLNPALLRDALRGADEQVRGRELAAPAPTTTQPVPGTPLAPGTQGDLRANSNRHKGPQL